MHTAQYLLHDPVNLAVLGVDLLTHVQGHVTQIANNASHLLQVLVHLVLPGVICYPGTNRRRKECDQRRNNYLNEFKCNYILQ